MTVNRTPKRPRGRPPSISREQILEAAHSLPSHELTMPAVAKILGVKTPALYHHFKNRNDLLRTMGEELIQGLDVSTGDPQQWRSWLLVKARDSVAFYVDNPVLMELDNAARSLAFGMQLTESVLETLEGAGFTAMESFYIWNLVSYHISTEARIQIEMLKPGYEDQLAVFEKTLESYRLKTPRTCKLFDELGWERPIEHFEVSLRWIIEKIPEPG